MPLKRTNFDTFDGDYPGSEGSLDQERSTATVRDQDYWGYPGYPRENDFPKDHHQGTNKRVRI
jgi:hypothetical protein